MTKASSSQRSAEEASRLLASIVESSDDAIITKDLNGVITSWNKGAERIFGYSAEDAIGKPISMIAAPGRADEMSGILERIKGGERIDHYQTVRKAKNGALVNISLTVSPLRNEDGHITGASKIARDITQQVRAAEKLTELHEALKKSEAETRRGRDWFLTTLSSIGDAVIATDAEGRVTFLNTVGQALTGWAPDDAAGHPLDQVFVIQNEETGAIVENPVTKVLREGGVVGLANHTKLIAKNGREIPIDDSAAPIRDAAGKITGVVLVFRDVTERKEAEETLRRAIVFDEAVLANMGEGLYTVDMEGRVTSMNPAAAKLFGWSFEELRGKKMHAMTHHHHRDGRPFPAEDCTGLRVLKEGKTLIDHEDVFIRKDGTYFDVVYSSSPLKSGGDIAGLIVVFRDVSARKESEKELRRANADLKQFAFAASHDLQEPLRMITSYAQLLVKGTASDDKEAGLCVKFITEGTQRIRELLADLLNYTQVNADDEKNVEAVNLDEVFEEAVGNLKIAIAESRAAVTHEKLPVVAGLHAHILQVLQNLISNALKYRGGRVPRVHITALREGTLWRLAVTDNGMGIDPEHYERIFGVFKRLHGKTIPGTGIGLAICQRVVERYGGRIWVESKVGEGSTFYFTLPAVEGAGA